MKLLSFQPFSLFSNGGGNRILRRLYQGHENDIFSIAIIGYTSDEKKGSIREHIIYTRPYTRRWMRWYLRTFVIWLRDHLFHSLTIQKIRKEASAAEYDILHVVNHGPFSAALCNHTFCGNKQLWVSFHDHFTTTYSTRAHAALLWKMANRRLVISEELGREYQRLFGGGEYEIITDGIEEQEISEPVVQTGFPVVIYFAGLLHLDYVPLFRVLADALDVLSDQGMAFKLVLRGTQLIPLLDNRLFEIEYRPLTLDNSELKNELDAAAILYLPIKFAVPDFYLYSLSTKMVGYLGGSGAILYHGPEDSAACRLLQHTGSAVCCTSLDKDDLAGKIKEVLRDNIRVSEQGKIVGKERFGMRGVRARFWKE